MTDLHITCNQCSGLLTVSTEFIGELVQCPVCDAETFVPRPGRAVKLELRVKEQPRQLDPDDEEALHGLDPALLNFLQGATNKNCWEFGLVARLIYDALRPLRELVEDTPASAHVNRETRAPQAAKMLRNACRQLLASQMDLGQLFGTALLDALFLDDIDEMIALRRELDGEVERIVDFCLDFFSETVPPQAPYPALYTILKDWPEHWLRCIEVLVEQLHEMYDTGGESLPLFEPQIVLSAPTLHQAHILRAQL